MSYPVASRKADFQSPPRAFQAAGPEGQVAVLAVSTTAIAVDLTQGFSQGPRDTSKAGFGGSSTPSQNYLAFVANVDVGIVFGPTLASVTGANAPAIATTGTLASNVYTGAAGTCWVVPAGTGMKFLAQPGLDKFVAIVGSAAGVVRLCQLSPDNA